MTWWGIGAYVYIGVWILWGIGLFTQALVRDRDQCRCCPNSHDENSGECILPLSECPVHSLPEARTVKR